MFDQQQSQEYSDRLTDLAVQIFNFRGKRLEFYEEAELKNFFAEKGARLRTLSGSERMKLESNLESKLSRIITPSMSLKDILRRLCPLDPIC